MPIPVNFNNLDVHNWITPFEMDPTNSVVEMEKRTGSDALDVNTVEKTVEKRTWRFHGVFVCLMILNFICAIDATILAVALPTIASSLIGTTAIEAFWCGTSFLLCSTVFQPTWASLSHMVDRKSIVLASLGFFTLGTIIASAAPNIAALLVGRSIQGVGGGGMITLTYVIISDMVPLHERPRWQNLISAMWALGSVIGPVIGGAIAESGVWRGIFWLNIPFCVVAAVGVPICLQLHSRAGTARDRMKKFDYIGSFIFIGASASLLIPITWGGIMYDWQSWRTLVPLIIGIVGLVGFVFYNVYFSAEPLIRHTLFNSSTAITGYSGTFLHGLLLWALLWYMPLYFEIGQDYDAVHAGIAIFPFTMTVAPASVVVGFIIARTGKYRPSIWIGWFLTTLGLGLLIHLERSTSVPAWIFLSLVGGIGMGMNYGAQGFAVQASVSNDDIPFAGAMYSFFRSFGQTLGVAISGVVFQNTFKNRILASAYASQADAWSRDASAFVQVVKTWSDHGAEGAMKDVVVQAYVESLRMVWIIMCALSFAMLIASVIWIKEISLVRELETEQGFKHKSNIVSSSDSSGVESGLFSPKQEKGMGSDG